MAATQQNWNRVNRKSPCPICSKFKGCLVSANQDAAICIRITSDHVMHSGLGGWLHSLSPQAGRPLPAVAPLVVPSQRRAQPHQLDLVYQALLQEHELTPAHARHLQDSRQLSPEAIHQRGYRSWGSLRYQRGPIAQSVYARLGAIALDTPGVIQREQNGSSYLTLAGAPGIAIPVRDADGSIVGLQIRSDDPLKAGKYQWLSSTSRGGPSPGTPLHVARPRGPCAGRRVWLTEGPLKADIACENLGEIVVAVPGIQAIKDYQPTLTRLKERDGIQEVVIALDSDWHSKPQVHKARLLLAERAARLGFMVWLSDWTENCKGLDDLLLAGGKPKLEAYQVQGNGPRALEELPPTASPKVKGVNLNEARKLQTAALNDFLEARRPPGVSRGLLLNALPGAGKSYALTQAINRFIGKRSRTRATVFVARHDLAHGPDREQWAFTRGRSHVEPGKNQLPPCHQGVAQSRLNHLRIPAKLGCERCPLLEMCRDNRNLDPSAPFYLGQFHQNARVTVHPMQHFMIPTMYEHSRVVAIDDSDLISLCLEDIDIGRTQLEKALDWTERFPEHDYALGQPLLALLVALTRQAPHGEFSWQGIPLFVQLEKLALDHGLPLSQVLEQAARAKEPDPFGDDDLVHARLDVPMRFLAELTEILSFEYTRFQTRASREWEEWNHRIRLERTFPGEDMKINLKSRRSLPLAGLAGKDLIISDASLTLEEAERLFPERQWTQVNPTVRMPDSVNIIQYPEQAWGKVRLRNPKVQEQAMEQIGDVLARHPHEKIALITHKSFADLVKTRFPQLKVGHFFGQRGSNAFKDCDILIVFGTPHPNPGELLRQAQALHWDESTVLPHEFLERRRFETAPNTPSYQVPMRSYADPRLSNLLRSKIEDELIQSIYRIRPLSVNHSHQQLGLNFTGEEIAPERSKATVYVFSSRPLPGLEVALRVEPKSAQVIDFREAAIKIHARRQVVTEERLAQETRRTCYQVRQWKTHGLQGESGFPTLANPPPVAQEVNG